MNKKEAEGIAVAILGNLPLDESVMPDPNQYIRIIHDIIEGNPKVKQAMLSYSGAESVLCGFGVSVE